MVSLGLNPWDVHAIETVVVRRNSSGDAFQLAVMVQSTKSRSHSHAVAGRQDTPVRGAGRAGSSGSNSIVCAFSGTSDASNWTTVDHKSRSPGRGSRRKPLINNGVDLCRFGKGEVQDGGGNR